MKKLIATLAVALMVIAGSVSAHASIFFDPTGTGSMDGAFEISGLDWNVGAGVAVDSVIPADGSTWTHNSYVYMQSLLSVFNLAGGGVQAVNGYEVTAIAGFEEVGTYTANEVNFALKNPDNSYFQAFWDADSDANVNTGYNDGTKILDGIFTDVQKSDFELTGNLVDFDSSGADTMPGYGAMEGSGNTIATITLNYLNPFFFLLDQATQDALDAGSLYFTLTFKAGQSLPFEEALPPTESIDTKDGNVIEIDYEGLAGFGDYDHIVGAPNGDGSPGDFVFQIDGSSKFGTVPEPATILLSGLGLLVLGFFCRKNQVA
ncbi:PEP-CTERM sorting domain-containing protein [Desulfovibrio subterraneus]|uniref:Ice-binding protein C-terminal domain-containing protein n=1 Tax=Desulfovibrio subterraneus TaxID=2718620 RepID=A0A7J0BJC7_9BACT|nr:PEP-CTERM sorting domain-containing protein [Desulfovibrio subterraneus]GFM33184.1 hypothetical protein DSM101010T_15490 [Desulfovibrio subterraneus]